MISVLQFGNNWKKISISMPGRNARQCRERWNWHLDPDINKGPFTREEDELLLRKRDQDGLGWKGMEEFFPGRTDNKLKGRYYCLKREQDKYYRPVTRDKISNR
jgi:hypothetical protein